MNFKSLSAALIASASLLYGTSVNAGPAAYKTDYRYNAARQVTGVIKPDPDGSGPLKHAAVRNTYNSQGLLTRVENGELSSWQGENIKPENWGANVFNVLTTIEYTYDIYGRKTSEIYTDAPGNVHHLKQYNHDHLGRVKCEMTRMASWLVSDPCNAEYTNGQYDRITRYDYDIRDNITRIQKAYDTNLQQNYARNTYRYNRLESTLDANGNKTEFKYDGFGRLTRINYPSKTSTGSVNSSDNQQYTYDAANNIKSERKRNGWWIEYQYDNLNQRILKDLSGSTEDVNYTYNNLGLETYIEYRSSGDGIRSTYNGFGELLTSTNELLDNVQLRYQYDSNGNRTRITHPDNVYFQYGYDGLNRLNSLKENTSTLLNISYFPNGKRKQISRVGSSPDTFTNYEWDGIDRIASITHNVNGSSYDVTYGFGYNRANQIKRHTINNNNYVYVGNNNRTGVYQVNGLNQYTKINGQTISYDAKGNLTNDGVYRYTFDTENRLKTATGPKSASFNYDPRGRLISVNENGSTKYFLYDGDMLVAELNSSETVLKRYVGGSGVDELLVQYDSRSVGSSYRRYVHTDHQSSVIGLSNNSGNMISRFKYDAFGIPSSSNTSRFGYTGQLYFKDLGLNYYKARIYHPKLGRFLQTDPIGYEDQMNLYAYVHNDPINNTDPTGMCTNDSNADASDICQTTANMSLSPNGANHIKTHENRSGRLDVHDDGAGNPTSGYGHKDNSMTIGDTITQEQADADFASDAATAEGVVKSLVGSTPLSQNEFDALTDLAFNVGAGTLDNSPNLKAAIAAGDYEGMSNNLKYTKATNKATGQKVSLPGLIDRSSARRDLFRGNLTYKNP